MELKYQRELHETDRLKMGGLLRLYNFAVELINFTIYVIIFRHYHRHFAEPQSNAAAFCLNQVRKNIARGLMY